MVRLLTVPKASKECGVSQDFIRAWIKEGKCPGVYSGSRFLVNVELFEERLKAECAK